MILKKILLNLIVFLCHFLLNILVFASTSFGSVDIYPVADLKKLDAPVNTRCVENGNSVAIMCSELISLYRFLLISPQWSRNLRNDLNHSLNIPFELLESEMFQNPHFTGSLMVLGGFNEPLRSGGIVQIQSNAFLVLSLKVSQAHILNLNEAINSIVSGAPLSNAIESTKPFLIYPVSEFIIDGSVFPIDDGTFFLFNKLLKCFKQLIDSDPSEDLKLNAYDIMWRIIYILDNVVTSSIHFNIDKKELLELIKVLASLKNIITKSGKACIVEKLEEVRFKLWNVNNNKLTFPLATSFIYPKSNHFNIYFMDQFLSTSINMDILYGQSPYIEMKNASKTDDNKMLKFWEKHIIPKIQEYVRGSFKDYEMLYFFEALRQPLRLGNASAALEVVNTLCARKIPEHIIFPPVFLFLINFMFILVGQRLVCLTL